MYICVKECTIDLKKNNLYLLNRDTFLELSNRLKNSLKTFQTKLFLELQSFEME